MTGEERSGSAMVGVMTRGGAVGRAGRLTVWTAVRVKAQMLESFAMQVPPRLHAACARGNPDAMH